MKDKDTLNKLIDAIPGICEGGREGVRNLVAAITDVDLTKKPEPTYSAGLRCLYLGRQYMLASLGSTGINILAVDMLNGRRYRPAIAVRDPKAITLKEISRIFNGANTDCIQFVSP